MEITDSTVAPDLEEVTTDSAPAELGADVAKPKPRLHRGADPMKDGVWTRNHAICTMGVAFDLAVGGYDAARAMDGPPPQAVGARAIVDKLRLICPWLEDPLKLNFVGLATLEKRGLSKAFDEWVYNRLYHFASKSKPTEHPAVRKKAHLREIYEDFYLTFSDAIAAGTPISEEEAKAFWLSVADRVPFIAPATSNPNH